MSIVYYLCLRARRCAKWLFTPRRQPLYLSNRWKPNPNLIGK